VNGGRILVAAVSARALAESAGRAGWSPVSVDAFGDLDTARWGPALGLGPDLGLRYSAAALVRACAGVRADAVVYGANLENAPSLVERLAHGRVCLGNLPGALRVVRDPLALAGILSGCAAAGVRVPRTWPPGVVPEVAGPGAAVGAGSRGAQRASSVEGPRVPWLRKRLRSGGGLGVGFWRPGVQVGRGAFVQEFVEGVPGSAAFVSDGRRARLLGLTRQWVGARVCGARGFRYSGSVWPFGDDPDESCALSSAALAAGDALVRAAGLRGVWGFDFVARDGTLFVVEVNPRYTASMEVLERVLGLSLFRLHVDACAGALPDARALRPRAAGAWGKAIVYAPRALRLGDTRSWLRRRVRDVPRPGTRVRRGGPVCTLLARARTRAGCEAALRRRAREWRTALVRSGAAPLPDAPASGVCGAPFVAGRRPGP
jgi:predicted ATP-grasp superfamily ATP-dependent carboligase